MANNGGGTQLTKSEQGIGPAEARHLLGRLDAQIEQVVLVCQHPVSGLLPASTAHTVHGNDGDAWVRDCAYSIQCVWGLALAPTTPAIAAALEGAELRVGTGATAVRLASSQNLAWCMALVGVNAALALSGHPPVRMETMATGRSWQMVALRDHTEGAWAKPAQVTEPAQIGASRVMQNEG